MEQQRNARAVPPRLVGVVAGLGVGAAAFGFVAAVPPGSGHALAAVYLPCPSLTLFGVLCPLCGGTRAARALVTGDLLAVPGRNALLPLLLVLGSWALVASLSGGRVRSVPRSGRFWAVIGILTLLYGVLRNLPWEPFVWLAP